MWRQRNLNGLFLRLLRRVVGRSGTYYGGTTKAATYNLVTEKTQNILVRDKNKTGLTECSMNMPNQTFYTCTIVFNQMQSIFTYAFLGADRYRDAKLYSVTLHPASAHDNVMTKI